MFHKATEVKFKSKTTLEVTFQDGKVIRYDMAVLFDKYPKLRALENRDFFCKGQLMGYGIIWNDELDIEAETIYEEGKVIRTQEPATGVMVGNAVSAARAKKGMSLIELAEVTGIDQSDISKIERGVANPSIKTLHRIAEALDAQLRVSIG